MEKNMKHLIAGLALFVSADAMAVCQCACVGGQMQAICTNALDLEPICPPTICPIVPAAIQPIQPLTLPPLGASRCEQEQVYNEYTDEYEWQTICY